MPTYDYRCDECGYQFEEFQSITAKPLRKCKKCGKMKLVRLLGTGAGIIFKGSGFYETDYRSDSYKKAAENEKPKSDKGSSSEGGDSNKSKEIGKEGKAEKSETKSGGGGEKSKAGKKDTKK
jgi:putative FmdB family regulatory protein